MITLLIIMLLMSLFNMSKTPEAKGPVTYLQYSRSEMRYRVEYVFKRAENGDCTLTKIEGYQDETGQTIVVPASVADKLWEMVEEHKMRNYKSSYTPKMRVLDGYMWKLQAEFAKGERLYTGGDNEMPDGGIGIKQLVNYLAWLWDKQNVPPIREMVYREDGTVAYPLHYYKLEKDYSNDCYIFTNASNCRYDEARSAQVPNAFADEIRQIVKEESMFDYAPDYQPEYEVLDGRSWRINMRFEGTKSTISSSGREAYPAGEGLRRIEQLCYEKWKELEPKSKPAPLQSPYE